MAVATADFNPEPEESSKEAPIDPARVDASNGKVRASVPLPNPQAQAAKRKPKK